MDFFTKVNGWMFQTFLESVNILGESPRQVPKTKQQKTEPQTKSLINLHYLKAKMIKQTISHTKKEKESETTIKIPIYGVFCWFTKNKLKMLRMGII